MMNSDLQIVRLPEDRELCDDLLLEFAPMGLHTSVADPSSPADLERQISDGARDHAFVMPFITEAFVDWLESANITLPNPKPEVLSIAFGLKAEAKGRAQRRIKGVEFSSARGVASLAEEVLRAIAANSRRGCLRIASGLDIWRTPLYIFRKKDGFKDREILVDVTWSAKPTRPEMAPALETALRKTIDYLGKKSLKILDFGAGKLRHTVPLLKLGHEVTAVDYRDLFDKPSEQVRVNLEAARTYGSRFKKIVYPGDFVSFGGKFDLALVVNVINIMPDPLERLFVLEHCGNKLRKDGHLLWFCQHGDAYQISAASDAVTDGGCTTGKGRKTFYVDYNNREHIVRLLRVVGFKDVTAIKLEAGNNHAILFEKAKPAILQTQVIIEKTRRVLERKVFVGETASEVAVANVFDAESHVGFGAALAEALASLDPGKGDAYNFEDIITVIVEYVFQRHFTSSSIRNQVKIYEDRKRIDIIAEWRANSSLKTLITQDNHLKSSFVPIECKNYSDPLKNEEYGQLVDRCDRRHRTFGIITCRRAGDWEKVIKQCNDRYNQHEYLLIVLDDSDLKELLRYADEADGDAIVEYISRKIMEVRDLASRR